MKKEKVQDLYSRSKKVQTFKPWLVMDQTQWIILTGTPLRKKCNTDMHYFLVWFMDVCCLTDDFLFFYSQSRRVHCYYDWRYLASEEEKLTQHKREESLAASITLFCTSIHFCSWSDAENCFPHRTKI